VSGAALLTTLAVLAVALPAGAQRLEAELRVGGGWDDNPQLAAPSDNRRLPDRAPAAGGQGLFAVSGLARGAHADGPWRLAARLDVSGGVYERGDALFYERLELEVAFDLPPVTPRCAVAGERLDTGFGDDDAWAVVGRCGARLALLDGLGVQLDGLAGARAFDLGQTDVLGGAALTFDARLDWLELGAGLEVWRRESDDPQARRTELVPWAAAAARTEWVGAALSYRFVRREFEVGSRTGDEHVARLSVWARPLPWLGPWVSLELGHASGQPRALAYDRFAITGGLRVELEVEPPPPPPPPGPVTASGGRARFRFALDAEEVSVIGDFNGWDPARGRLREVSPGVFEGTFPVSPGAHRYHLLVDGEPRRPPGSARYVRDDFGGENAVFEAEGVSGAGPGS